MPWITRHFIALVMVASLVILYMGIQVNREPEHPKRMTYGIIDSTQTITELMDAQSREMARKTGDPDALKAPKVGLLDKMKMKIEDKLTPGLEKDMGLTLPKKGDHHERHSSKEKGEEELWNDNLSAEIEEHHQGLIGSAMHAAKDKVSGTVKNATNKVKSKIGEKFSEAWEYTKDAIETKFEEFHNRTKEKLEETVMETLGSIRNILPGKKIPQSESESMTEPTEEKKVVTETKTETKKVPVKGNKENIEEKTESLQEKPEPEGQFAKKMDAQKATLKEGIEAALNAVKDDTIKATETTKPDANTPEDLNIAENIKKAEESKKPDEVKKQPIKRRGPIIEDNLAVL